MQPGIPYRWLCWVSLFINYGYAVYIYLQNKTSIKFDFQLNSNYIFFGKGPLWREEVEDQLCMEGLWSFEEGIAVTNQLQCQQYCESKPNCVGMGYSYKNAQNGNTQNCFACFVDTMTPSANDFGFYRRPGIATL